MSQILRRNRSIPLNVVNTCAFDTVAQIILTSMYTWADSVQAVEELAHFNMFFKFINNIYTRNGVSGTEYLERLAVLQKLRPYRNALQVMKTNNTPTHARFDAETNLAGLMPFLLEENAPSIMLQMDECDKGHAVHPVPLKVLTYSASILTNRGLMSNVVVDAVESYTAESAKTHCQVRGCKSLRRRSFVGTGMVIFFRKYFSSICWI